MKIKKILISIFVIALFGMQIVGIAAGKTSLTSEGSTDVNVAVMYSVVDMMAIDVTWTDIHILYDWSTQNYVFEPTQRGGDFSFINHGSIAKGLQFSPEFLENGYYNDAVFVSNISRLSPGGASDGSNIYTDTLLLTKMHTKTEKEVRRGNQQLINNIKFTIRVINAS